MKELVDQLKRNRTLSPEELRLLLTDASPEEREYLHRAAREVARVHFGNGVFVRGLIEISNYCRNDCRYCGIRRSNRLAERYRLTPETVLACCEEGYRLGFRTFVLQSGEDPALNAELLTGLIRNLRALKDEKKLKKLYIKESDERQAQIVAKALCEAMRATLILGLAAVIVAGYFSMTVSLTLLVTVLLVSLMTLALKLYFGKKY